MSQERQSYARRILTTAAIYAAAAWAAVEALLTVIDRFGLPAEWGTLITALFVAGLPVTLFLVWHTAGPDRKASLSSVGGSIVALVAGTAWIYIMTLPEPLPSATAVAVVPCEIEGDQQYAYRAEGLAEDVHARLSLVDSVKISSWNSSLFVHERGFQPPQIAETLKIDRLVRCRIHSDADRITLSTEVIDPAANTVLWNRDYDFAVSDLGTVVTELASTLLDVLGTTAQASELERVNDLGTFSSEAYDLLLRAKGIWRWPSNVEEYVGEAEALVEQVLQIDPNYAEALVYRAELYMTRFNSTHVENLMEIRDMAHEARTLLRRALEINPHAHSARSGLAGICGSLGGYFNEPCPEGEAERLEREECEIRGDTAKGWACLHRLHSDEDNYQYLERWLELEPTSMPGKAQAVAHLWLEFHDPVAAMARFDTLTALYPGDLRPPGLLSNVLRKTGRLDEVVAWRWASFGDEIPEGQPWALARLGTDYMNLGLYEEALEVGLMTRETRRWSAMHFVPDLWASKGKTDLAAEELEWAGEELVKAAAGDTRQWRQTAVFMVSNLRNYERAMELFDLMLAGHDVEDICFGDFECPVWLLLVMAHTGRALGQDRRADAWVAQAEAMAARSDPDGLSTALLRIAQNRIADAVTSLREAIFTWDHDGYDIPLRLHQLEHEALFDPLRDKPEFQVLLEEYRAYLAPMRERVLESKRNDDWQSLRQRTYQWVESLDS